MANGRRPIPPMRAYTAAVLGVFALFVISAGAGMASWSIVVLGLALMILAVSLVVVSAMRGGARAYVAGTAHVVSASEPPASSVYGRCELHLVIDAPGMAAAAVKIRDPRVPVAKWPDAGSTLPIMVAVDDPRRVRIQWDDVATHARAADEDQLSEGYAEDYSDEYPEYVPRRDPLHVPADRPPTERAEPATDRGEAAGSRGEAAGGRGGAPPTAGGEPEPVARGEPEPVARGEPATADLTEELADLPPEDPAPDPAPAAAAATAPGPPAPRRPEATPETPEESYPVDGEPVFSPKVPPAPDRADLVEPGDGAAGAPDADPATSPAGPAPDPATPADPATGPVDTATVSGHAGSGPGTPPSGDGGAPPEPVTPEPSGAPMDPGRPPRPRPRPHATPPDERASAGERAAGAAHAAAGARRGPVAATGTAVADPQPATVPGARQPTQPPQAPQPDPLEQAGQGEESEDSPTTPSVTAIEFDLGQLITAYPSARPGRAGEIHGVGITVLVRDLARSAAFYRDILGFYEIDGGGDNVVLASGDTRVVLRAVPDAPPVDRRMVHINLEVADVHAVYEELKAKGVRFTSGPRPTAVGERLEPWTATFRDPDGHGIAITQWRTRGR